VLITSMTDVPEVALIARIRAAAALPLEIRARIAVQLRDPDLTTRARFDLGARLLRETRAAGLSLLVNDRLDLALALAADGVHLGHRSVTVADARALLGPDALISVACHSVPEVLAAAAQGASAALLSPIFASPGKGPPLGLSALQEARRALDHSPQSDSQAVHLLALGGVDATNAAACLTAGADGVAAIRADLIPIAVSTLASDLAT
jgi:thiamine-phosphate pyrophosphorylase